MGRRSAVLLMLTILSIVAFLCPGTDTMVVTAIKSPEKILLTLALSRREKVLVKTKFVTFDLFSLKMVKFWPNLQCISTVCVFVCEASATTTIEREKSLLSLSPLHQRTIHNGAVIFTCSYNTDPRHREDDQSTNQETIKFSWYLNGVELRGNSSHHVMMRKVSDRGMLSYLRVDPVRSRKKEDVYSCGVPVDRKLGGPIKRSNNATLTAYRYWSQVPPDFPRLNNNSIENNNIVVVLSNTGQDNVKKNSIINNYSNNNIMNNNNIIYTHIDNHKNVNHSHKNVSHSHKNINHSHKNTHKLIKIEVKNGQTIIISCPLHCDLNDQVHVNWYKNFIPLHTNNHKTMNNDNNNIHNNNYYYNIHNKFNITGTSNLKTANHGELQLVNISQTDDGYYECSMESKHGIVFSPKILIHVSDDAQDEGYMSDDSKNLMSTQESYLIKALKKFRNYSISVVPYTTNGSGPSSNALFVQTWEDVPGMPQNLQVQALNSTCIHVQWQPPTSADLNGVIRGYQVYCMQVSATNHKSAPVVLDITNGSATEVTVVDLMPGTTYQVQVAAYNRMGDGEKSDGKNITTAHQAMDAPRNLTLTLTLGERPSILATWKPPQTVVPVNQYKVQYGIKGQPHTMNQEFVEGNRLKFQTRYLEKGVEYELSVSAKSLDEEWGEEAVGCVVTPEGAPMGAPLNVSSTDITSQSFKLTWAPPMISHQNGRIVMYEIRELSDQTMDDWMTNTTENFFLISNLESRARYTYQVRAYTAVGSGPWSSSTDVHTLPEKWILRSALNIASDGEVVKEGGRDFQRREPQKANADLARVFNTS
ncbi:hypothetical protein HELRODRAFT_169099 [Helobdella robusta]|uniref:Uncharacterized protein n=1 Tax=Helobdella robusta TaxID=6412 RepID=T1F1E2_HELRO|nr:hypothetical protein HELRODRAFT_169099 [Helobdella robusta]ESO09155.1 hypothetical protein HELRODRAFT_169099 [Helobdella robusta]